MNTGPKKRPVVLTDPQRAVLTSLVRRWRTPQQIAKRARVILESEQEMSNLQISKRIPLDRPQVGVWRERWIDQRERLRLVEIKEPDELESVMMVVIACEDPKNSGRPVSHWPLREIRDEAISRGIVKTISRATRWPFFKIRRI